MDDQLILTCFIAMGEVFVLLSIMAVVITVITRIFPGSVAPAKPARRAKSQGGPSASASSVSAGGDPAMVAAISVAAAQAQPGSAVTHIQEITR